MVDTNNKINESLQKTSCVFFSSSLGNILYRYSYHNNLRYYQQNVVGEWEKDYLENHKYQFFGDHTIWDMGKFE